MRKWGGINKFNKKYIKKKNRTWFFLVKSDLLECYKNIIFF